MLQSECIKIFERFFPFWSELSESDRRAFCRYTSAVRYRKGENVHGGDGNCTGAIVVRSGVLRVYMLSEAGKEVTLYRLFPGDVCMLSASCVLRAVTFDVFVDAEEDSDTYVVGGKVFAEVADRNLYVQNYALSVAVERFSDVMWVMQQILFMSLDKRLAIFLHDETVKTGSDTVPLTHEQIARYMGSARETVTRMLKYFAAEGIVEASRSSVRIVDKQKLNALIAQ